eukprot:COSAG06_NODE_21160_length_767_cov_1.588323_1_plen_163_part_10
MTERDVSILEVTVDAREGFTQIIEVGGRLAADVGPVVEAYRLFQRAYLISEALISLDDRSDAEAWRAVLRSRQERVAERVFAQWAKPAASESHGEAVSSPIAAEGAPPEPLAGKGKLPQPSFVQQNYYHVDGQPKPIQPGTGFSTVFAKSQRGERTGYVFATG